MDKLAKSCAFIATILGMMLIMIAAAPAAAQETYGSEPLPISGSDWRRLTPRQYLHLRYAEAAPLMDRIINCESGWKSDAKNPGSSATGNSQFIRQTWISTRSRMGLDTDLGLRFDPYASVDTAVWLLKEDGPTHWECYTLRMT